MGRYYDVGGDGEGGGRREARGGIFFLCFLGKQEGMYIFLPGESPWLIYHQSNTLHLVYANVFRVIHVGHDSIHLLIVVALLTR